MPPMGRTDGACPLAGAPPFGYKRGAPKEPFVGLHLCLPLSPQYLFFKNERLQRVAPTALVRYRVNLVHWLQTGGSEGAVL